MSIVENVFFGPIRRVFYVFQMLLLSNMMIISGIFEIDPKILILITVLIGLLFILYNIFPVRRKVTSKKLEVMIGGHELLIDTLIIFILEVMLYLYLCLTLRVQLGLFSLFLNGAIGMGLILIMMWNGIIRIAATSSQIGFRLRVLMFLLWWIPIINILVFNQCCRVVRREYIMECDKIELNNVRKDSNVCKTKYPILFIHGIFWRDWQFFNYWGRIPTELIKNGATVYFGNQQSAASMDICSSEIKEQILNIIEKEQCKKVNIIAHSKGGLDARYAISCLGIDKQVASLTTIGTPHHGCSFVDRIVGLIPDNIIRAIAGMYNSAYKRLGDKDPDFYSGLYDLTVKKCVEFNQNVPDKAGVVYQSVASKMNGLSSAGFPLNIGYIALHRREGENDGFVSVASSRWGDFLGCYATKRKRGVSHGDMIDLMRENINGFDVRECYVDIVKGLKSMGL